MRKQGEPSESIHKLKKLQVKPGRKNKPYNLPNVLEEINHHDNPDVTPQRKGKFACKASKKHPQNLTSKCGCMS